MDDPIAALEELGLDLSKLDWETKEKLEALEQKIRGNPTPEHLLSMMRQLGIDPVKLVKSLRKDTTTTTNYGTRKPGRNQPCPCGSSKKFKKCCGGVLCT